jgi:hypothetical protein
MRPETIEDAAALVSEASASGRRLRIGEDLVTDGLGRVLEHEAGDLTCTVEAGIRLSALQTTLARAGQRLSLDPPGDPTVGACLASRLSGPLSHRFGTPREVLGRFVPPALDVADVGRIEAHAPGELLLRHPALDPPLCERRHEVVGRPLDWRGGHHGCPLCDRNFSVHAFRCPQGATSALPTDTLTNRQRCNSRLGHPCRGYSRQEHLSGAGKVVIWRRG